MKSKFFANFILSLFLVSSSIVIYAAPVVTNDSTVSTSILDSNMQTEDTLISMENRFVGEGRYYFDYHSGYLKLCIENTGTNDINYTIKYPCGCKLVSGSMKSGKQILFHYFDPELHGSGYGHTSVGQYYIYIYNDDGSLSSVKISAQSIKK